MRTRKRERRALALAGKGILNTDPMPFREERSLVELDELFLAEMPHLVGVVHGVNALSKASLKMILVEQR